jgi:hypothetical protein
MFIIDGWPVQRHGGGIVLFFFYLCVGWLGLTIVLGIIPFVGMLICAWKLYSEIEME